MHRNMFVINLCHSLAWKHLGPLFWSEYLLIIINSLFIFFYSISPSYSLPCSEKGAEETDEENHGECDDERENYKR